MMDAKMAAPDFPTDLERLLVATKFAPPRIGSRYIMRRHLLSALTHAVTKRPGAARRLARAQLLRPGQIHVAPERVLRSETQLLERVGLKRPGLRVVRIGEDELIAEFDRPAIVLRPIGGGSA